MERVVGQGGMAVVYLARDQRHGRDVAVKIFRSDTAPPDGAGRFLSEIRIAARLSHPNILPLHDSGEAEGLLYYVMPYVPGETLRQRLEREGALPVVDALAIAAQVASALSHAHSHGVIHRDIKPENILFQAGQAVVADFGIARAISAGGWEEKDLVGGPVGTPTYMSPEQAQGGSRVDGRSDVFSLGCVLYEMLAGVPPFRGMTPEEIAVQHQEAPPPPVDIVRPTLPASMQQVVSRALEKHPADRYQTAQQLADALARLPLDPPTGGSMAAAPPRRRSLAERVQRAPRGWGVLGVAAAGLAILVYVTLGVGRPRGPVLDPSRYFVAPFLHRAGAAPQLLSGDQCARLIHDALTRWQDIALVDERWAADQLARLGHEPTLEDLVGIARRAGAGRLITGEVSAEPDSIRVRGALYDVDNQERALREPVVMLSAGLAQADARFAALADSLLVPRPQSAAAAGGAMGTRVLSAWRSYDSAHVALDQWDLDRATRLFRTATARDPGYAMAHLWLAQTRSWAGADAAEWREDLQAALRADQPLTPHARQWAEALSDLADRRYPEACERFSRMIARDSLDFRGWFGRAECRAQDPLVVRAPASPSGYAFRSSVQAATADYARALRVIPSVHRAFRGAAFERVVSLLFAETNVYRQGTTGPDDSLGFVAFPALVADTLSFTPYPRTALNNWDDSVVPASNVEAVDHSRLQLHAVTESWVAAFPASSAALEADARALELLPERAGTPALLDSTLGRLRAAGHLATNRDDRVRLGAAEIRVLLRAGRFAEAKARADTLLKEPSGGPSEADGFLAAIAALTGRATMTAAFNRVGVALPLPVLPHRRRLLPAELRETAAVLEAFAALGLRGDSLNAFFQRYEQQSQALLKPGDRAAADAALLARVYATLYPAPESKPLRPLAPEADYLLDLQSTLRRRDTAAVRQRLVDLDALRRTARPGDISVDATLMEAEIALQLGDTAGAIRRLDGSLNAISALGMSLVEQVPQAGSLVRAMILRARLAAALGDASGARRWAGPAAILWASADPPLQPIVVELRRMAGMR
ncbi:MAG: protein kinase [Gemmatimonadota bacterium]|nr:protein kinase [Gemmatimonadota bacterium]